MKVLPGHRKPWQKKFSFLLSVIRIVLLEILVFLEQFPFHILFFLSELCLQDLPTFQKSAC